MPAPIAVMQIQDTTVNLPMPVLLFHDLQAHPLASDTACQNKTLFSDIAIGAFRCDNRSTRYPVELCSGLVLMPNT